MRISNLIDYMTDNFGFTYEQAAGYAYAEHEFLHDKGLVTDIRTELIGSHEHDIYDFYKYFTPEIDVDEMLDFIAWQTNMDPDLVSRLFDADCSYQEFLVEDAAESAAASYDYNFHDQDP